ncbi:LysE family translocator [Chryseobacterium defluvii]|uniref:Threonine/homoserine/homoserine lactone efflux protein n=1 Tax=Chryseobacterium defluvii TaxID=160396 RepID=A0A495SBH6_9FLAO|nr:LysE family translocator [Chryseobacterium defluvii]RKS97588.1 threonine/homoserine/homoserine lactone efflux protein [Chryseobacterium defluvii]
MEVQLIISFLSASLLLSIIPGPDNIFVLTESITKGKKNGIAISTGLALGVLVHTVAAATGLSIIIQKSALAFSVIKYIGAAYLFYLAFMSLKEKKIELNLHENQDQSKENTIYLIRKGFLMNVLNPKVALFFIAFLPQFISKSGFNVTLQMFLLGIIFALQAFIVFFIISSLSSKLTKFVNNQKFWKITKWSKVCVLSGLGMALFFSKNK